MALGMIGNIEPYLQQKLIALQPEDQLVVATDGIIDICNEDGERLGLNRMSEWIDKHAGELSAKDLFNTLSKEIADFAPITKNTNDDITLMVLTRTLC